ncbi:hypothetical protein A2U01_0088961, partial [Trifolium medium]|nr:hypothetical protein [Trifolium medium]
TSDVPVHATASRNTTGSVSNLPRRKCTTSCPSGVNRSIVSRSWSMEWLNDHNHGDVTDP